MSSHFSTLDTRLNFDAYIETLISFYEASGRYYVPGNIITIDSIRDDPQFITDGITIMENHVSRWVLSSDFEIDPEIEELFVAPKQKNVVSKLLDMDLFGMLEKRKLTPVVVILCQFPDTIQQLASYLNLPNVKTVIELLDAFEDVYNANACPLGGRYITCFRAAVENNDSAMAEWLIRHDNLDNSEIEMALEEAASLGHFDMIKVMIRYGASQLDLAMLAAIRGHHHTIVRFLSDNGASASGQGLITAAQYDDVKLADYFIHNHLCGIDEIQSAIQQAINNASIKVIDYLSVYGG